MGLVSEYNRNKAGSQISGWKTNMLNSINTIDGVLTGLVNMKTDYPDDITEIDGYINQIKTAMVTVYNKY